MSDLDAQDTGYHDRRLAWRLEDPEFRAEFERQRALADGIVTTYDPGWAYCSRCNTRSEWATNGPNCAPDGLCRGRSILPIPTTAPRPCAPA